MKRNAYRKPEARVVQINTKNIFMVNSDVPDVSEIEDEITDGGAVKEMKWNSINIWSSID